MAKLRQKNVAAKLRNKNIFLLFGFFLFVALSYVLLPSYLPAGLLSICLAGVCVWLLVSPTIHYLPPTRHAVVSLDISGANKSIRFVRTNVGTYCPAIYTPKTDKNTVVQMVNSRLLKTDNGTIKSTSDFVPMDRYSNNGEYNKTVLAAFEFDLAGAICTYLCVLVRSKNDTIFDAVQLRQYLTYLQSRVFLAVLLVRFALAVATSLHFGYLLLCRFSPSPTLSEVRSKAPKPTNTVVVLEKKTIDKEVSYAN